MNSRDFCKMTKSEVDSILSNANFTADETEIFEMLSKGASIIEVSYKMRMSEITIKRRITLIKDKIERIDCMQIPIWEKIAITKQEAAEYSNIGINKIEEMLKEPRCPFVLYIGKKKLIKRKEFERFISDSIEL